MKQTKLTIDIEEILMQEAIQEDEMHLAPHPTTTAWWKGPPLIPLLLSMQWLYFWAYDLQNARIQVLLWGIPLAGLLALLLNACSQRSRQPLLTFWSGAISLALFAYTTSAPLLAWCRTHLMHSPHSLLKTLTTSSWMALPLSGALVIWLHKLAQQTQQMPNTHNLSHARAFHTGLWIGWSLLLLSFYRRADNGCTGVSSTYGTTMTLSFVALAVWAWLGWRSLRSTSSADSNVR